jgi:metal-responsive CopG/Arc/MetJ family transcriptional regulator
MRLADTLVQEQSKKSEVIREAIDKYLIEKEYYNKMNKSKKK